MIERFLHITAVTAVTCVLLGLALFAIDELRNASDQQIALAAGANPSAAVERQRDANRSGARNAIDDVDDVLLSPFTSVVTPQDDPWVQRGVPSVIALLVYGFGLGFLARFAHGKGAARRRTA